ncbi:TfoX/Sxy family protein [Inhella gelatinilytica]|uniref:TfoX/Sxy family protein n=1 Tax=Inhella gelatinilytica TaxID=2795030 RepID=A0A931IWW9_9BURK|nr:TfoX/Sxy family protein [Inhella gelatinilytica]MBH9554332.1 TfoX/Sxy family protein [Inhella gelatinilytica]
MTQPTDPFALHCIELLQSLGPTRARRMFGGVGLYVDELFIALIAFDRLYLKVSEAHRPAFEAAGCERFVYPMKDGTSASLNYWTAPEQALESPAEMRPWAQRALEAALAARKTAQPRKSKTAGRKASTTQS